MSSRHWQYGSSERWGIVVQECVSVDNVRGLGSFVVSPLAVSVQRTLVIELKYSTKSKNSYSFDLIIELDMIAR